MRAEFGRGVDHDQLVFEENLKPVDPDRHLGRFLFIFRFRALSGGS
jgi:hypothetical protein